MRLLVSPPHRRVHLAQRHTLRPRHPRAILVLRRDHVRPARAPAAFGPHRSPRCLDRHRLAPQPIRSTVIAGWSTHSLTTVVRMAAPVGVVSSERTDDGASGTPRSNSAVAGAGTGIRPWAHCTMPEPVGTARLVKRSTPS